MRVDREPDSIIGAPRLRPLRPLLPLYRSTDAAGPKKLSPKKSELAVPKSFSLGRCGIRQCRKINCNLASHRRYAAALHLVKNSSHHSTVPATQPLNLLQSNGELLDQLMRRIENLVIDTFPTLQFSVDRSSTFRRLAHHYFAQQIDRLIQLYSPQLDRRKYKQTMAEHALSNDVFCICITANAKIDMIMQGHIRKPDPASELVYATTANVLRQRLSSITQANIDWLLVLVIALVGFDLAFDRMASLKGHHAALVHLIRLKGGLHTVGHVLPYVINIDRFLAVFTGQPPAFSQSPLIPVPVCGEESPGPYGRAFEQSATSRVLDAEAVQFCLDQCKLIYLMESARISLIPHTAPAADAAILRYFLYQRDHLYSRATSLHAHYHETQNCGKQIEWDKCDSVSDLSDNDEITLSKSRCVVLATLIVQYHVTYDNYYTVKGSFLAAQLQSVLERQSPPEWNENADMLLWILFVMAVAVPQWEHHDWVLDRIRHWLKVTSKDCWPQSGWQACQLANIKEFVWAESKFDSKFEQVCRELVKDGPLVS